MTFWDTGQLRVMDVLGFARRRGVSVGVLLWDAIHFGSHLTNYPQHESKLLESVGVDVPLDDSSRKVRHVTQALHQKCAVVDWRIAFVGGIDLTWQDNGDYDRWDTHGHLVDSPERVASRSAPSHPWHDVHTQIEGPAVADVERNIVERWAEVAQRHAVSTWPMNLPIIPPAPLANGVPAHIVRTIPPDTYAFAPHGIGAIFAAYRNAIMRAQSSIYLESQYFWQHVFEGLDTKHWGGHNTQMSTLLDDLAAALRRGVRVGLVLPHDPNVGRRFTDEGIADVRKRAGDAAQRPSASSPGRLAGGFRRAGRRTLPSSVCTREGRHRRRQVVDGGVRKSQQSWNARRCRSSMSPWTIPSPRGSFAQVFCMEHVHPSPEERLALADPLEGLALLDLRAAANEERVRNREPLIGHLLPYITAAQAQEQGLPVDREHGWLDMLPGGAGVSPRTTRSAICEAP